MNSFVKIFVIAAISFALAQFLNGVHVDSFWTSLIFALVLAILNVFAKPLFILLTLPVTLITLGLFLFVINALMVLLASKIVDGFSIENFWWALLFSFILSFIMSFIDKKAGKEKNSQ